MINQSKWINSLPKKNINRYEEINQIDHYRWVNTIPKINKFNSVKKYSFLTIFFVSGLLLVSALKNEARKLEKEIENLQTSINIIQSDLDQANLDKEVLTSPENISRLAEEYLSLNLVTYQRNQIKTLNDKDLMYHEILKPSISKTKTRKNKSLAANIKLEVNEKIKKEKQKIAKLKKIYSDPNTAKQEIKEQVKKEISETKDGIKNIYNSPKDTFTSEKFQKWGAIQIVKAFLGMPIVPGR